MLVTPGVSRFPILACCDGEMDQPSTLTATLHVEPFSALVLTKNEAARGARRGGRNGRAQTRARALRAHAEGIYAEGTCIYLQLSPLSPPFSQVLLSFHQHRKNAGSGFWTVLVELLVRLLVAFPTAA